MEVGDVDIERVLWHNLREEPLLYINHRPYVVRDLDRPFANLEYTGIDRERVEDMEERLKQDVIDEARANNGRVFVTEETDDAELITFSQQITEAAIQTPKDVFHALVHRDGYDVDYLRLPVTDEKAPKEIDCDLLVRRCWDLNGNTSLVFNCQMGRGRTTTGMIIAAVLHLKRIDAFPQRSSAKWRPQWFRASVSDGTMPGSPLKNGHYGVVRSLLRIMEHGSDAKRGLDAVIDAADHMQNLREAVYKYREKLCSNRNEGMRDSLLRAALEYLERYCVLIAFAAYVSCSEFRPASNPLFTFEAFMSQRPEFKSILQRLLRRNPVSALGLKQIQEGTGDAQLVRSHSLDGAVFGEEITSALVRNRPGKVLGQHAILKEDQFPGIEDKSIKQRVRGAPNFRGLSNVPVYGVGVPTVDGIRRVLSAIGAGPDGANKTTALWFNWREEPLVYINGRPFVLREDRRPFKNLKEYTNINHGHLEEMEERLRQDVLQEAEASHGSIQLALEKLSGNKDSGILEYAWEEVRSEDSVATPAAVYNRLQQEGYVVEYHRLPLTDGTTPDVLDVDQILTSVERHGFMSPVVFNCQNGMGRTTVGMIIASLAYAHFTREQPSAFSTVLSSNPYDATHLRHTHFGFSAEEISTVDEDSAEDSTDEEIKSKETTSQREGDFLALRRLILLLDNGVAAKQSVDLAVDNCDLLVNIRTEIRKARRGRGNPETSNRNAAYSRGRSQLHRYCFLVAVAAFIAELHEKGRTSFEQWMKSRREVGLALDFILRDPTSALSATLPRTTSAELRQASNGASIEEEQLFLNKRQFRILNERTILKGDPAGQQKTTSSRDPNVRQVRHKSVYTIGDPSVHSLRALLDRICPKDAVERTAIIRDIREELVVYVKGSPYTRRDLKRPVSSLYHVGIAAEDMEKMENILCMDVKQEATFNSGTVLLHLEIARTEDSANQSDQDAAFHREDVTQAEEQVKPSVVGTWGHVDADGTVENGVFTPKDVYAALASEGYRLRYGRVPLSRSRTPQASDLDCLVGNSSDHENRVHVIVARASTGTSARFAASFLSMISPSTRQLHRRRSISERSESKDVLGEYRVITLLCRALPDGRACKSFVDVAIDECDQIGNLREDIYTCRHAAETDLQTRQLGLHYLHRYFYLIAYQCYRYHNDGESFCDWVNHRKELCHLVSTIELE